VMEVNQLTGYSALDLDQVKREVGTRLKRVEDNDDKMILYLDEVGYILSELNLGSFAFRALKLGWAAGRTRKLSVGKLSVGILIWVI